MSAPSRFGTVPSHACSPGVWELGVGVVVRVGVIVRVGVRVRVFVGPAGVAEGDGVVVHHAHGTSFTTTFSPQNPRRPTASRTSDSTTYVPVLLYVQKTFETPG
jgi:hypothetical protein